MKSIMEEASSIAKAIEKGWLRAGKPEEFSIKIFEHAEKNFFGFTVKPAKVGIFIPHHAGHKSHTSHHERDTIQSTYHETNRHNQPKPYVNGSENSTKKTKSITPSKYRSEQPEQQANSIRRPIAQWTDELSTFVQEWLSETFSHLTQTHAIVSKDASQEILSIYVSGPITSCPDKEQVLFKSLAHLSMEALRNKFKQNFKSLRILINHK